MSQKIVKYYGLAKMDDLTALSTGCSTYKTGDQVKIWQDNYSCYNEYVYVYCPVAITQYAAAQLKYSATCGQEVQAYSSGIATTTGAAVSIVVPQITVTSGTYCFALKRGKGSALIDGSSDMVAGDALHLTTVASNTALKYSGAVTNTLVSIAFAVTTQLTTGVAGTVYLPGEGAVISS